MRKPRADPGICGRCCGPTPAQEKKHGAGDCIAYLAICMRLMQEQQAQAKRERDITTGLQAHQTVLLKAIMLRLDAFPVPA
jgi:hypothetical protein